MMPTSNWSTNNRHTTQKYLTVASCDFVGFAPSIGSVGGSASTGSSCFRASCQNPSAPMPASSIRMLTPVHTIESDVGRFAISGSCGQLLVYVIVAPGRSVPAAHADQKKYAARARARTGSVTVCVGCVLFSLFLVFCCVLLALFFSFV